MVAHGALGLDRGSRGLLVRYTRVIASLFRHVLQTSIRNLCLIDIRSASLRVSSLAERAPEEGHGRLFRPAGNMHLVAHTPEAGGIVAALVWRRSF